MAWPTDITRDVNDYVTQRIKEGTLVWPKTTEDALLFAQTEISEAVEVLFARKDYIRNHPKDKPQWSAKKFSEELGDAIFMLIVASIMQGRDPIMSMYSKMRDNAHTSKK